MNIGITSREGWIYQFQPSQDYVLNKSYIREAMAKWERLKQDKDYLQTWDLWTQENFSIEKKDQLKRDFGKKWDMKFLLDPKMEIISEVLFGKPSEGSNEQLFINAIVYYRLGKEAWDRIREEDFRSEHEGIDFGEEK